MPAKDPKREALRQQGVLNPRPGDVTDQRFAVNSFFDPRDLVQVKYEMLRRVQADGHSVTQAAAAFGFSRPSFYQAQAAFAKQAHKLTEEVLDFIRETRQQDPRVRTGDVVRLIQQRFGTTVHPRSITRALSRHQKKLP